MRTFRHCSRQPLIALFDDPAVTMTAMRLVRASLCSSIAGDYAIELIGESLAITMVQRSLASGINATAA